MCSPASHLPAKSKGAAAPVPALDGGQSPVVFEDRGGLVQVRVDRTDPLEKSVLCPFADPRHAARAWGKGKEGCVGGIQGGKCTKLGLRLSNCVKRG